MPPFLRTLVHAGLAGPLALGLLACSLLLAVVVVVVAAAVSRETGGSRLRAVVLAEVVVFVPAVALLFTMAAAARRRVLVPSAALDVNPFANGATAWGEAFERCLVAIGAAGAALTIIGLLLVIAAGIWHIRSVESPLRAVLHVMVPMLLGVTGLALDRCAVELARPIPYHDIDCMVNKARCVDMNRARAFVALTDARLHVIAIAVLGTALLFAAALVSRRREGAASVPGAVGGAALSLVAGLACYAAARPLGADAQSPLPPPDDGDLLAICPDTRLDVRALPPAVGCSRELPPSSSVSKGPTLELEPGGAILDGALVDPETLAKTLDEERLRHPSRSTPRWSMRLRVLARADARTADLAPYFSAIRDGVDLDIVAVTIRPPERRPTSTLGDVGLLPRCCFVTLRLEPSGSPLSSFATWGDIVAAAALQPGFTVAP